MAQRVYALASDYYDFIGGDDPNENAEGQPVAEPTSDKELNARLRRASSVIDSHTRHDRYEVDDDGYPTNPEIADAFKEATCAQAQWFDETDDITGAASQEGTVSIGSVSMGARGRSSGGASADAAGSRIAPEAVEILRNVGLLSSVTAHS